MGLARGGAASGTLRRGQADCEAVTSCSEILLFFPQVRHAAASLTWLRLQRKVSSWLCSVVALFLQEAQASLALFMGTTGSQEHMSGFTGGPV